jgi:hypothetical protein
MTTNGDLDRTLATWFEREARTDGAATLLEATLGVTSRRRPRSAWEIAIRDGTLGWFPPAGRQGLARLRVVAIVVVLAVAFAVVGLLVAGGQQPPPAPPSPRPSSLCVGDPATLCSQPAGDWTSAFFIAGLTATFPDDGWYVRDLPDRVELKTAPMTSQAMILLDPIPEPESWEPSPDLSGTVPSLLDWLGRNPAVSLGEVSTHETRTGLAVTTFDVSAGGEGRCVQTLNTRANGVATHLIEVCHYVQRLHLVDLGGGHVLAILLVAFDSNPVTLDRFDAAFAPILDSLRPAGR